MLLAEWRSEALCLVCALLLASFNEGGTDDYDDEDRPYEFSFNIVDFQHRFEKKDKEGIITGEYGFITADGVYHETGYATNKDGDFIITKQRNRKIASLKDARDIFKDRPEAAEKLFEAVAKSCSGCKIPVKQDKDNKQRSPIVKTTKTNQETPRDNKIASIMKEMTKVLANKTNITPKAKETTVSHPKTVSKVNDIPRGPEKETREKIVKEMIEAAKKIVIEPRSIGKIESRILEESPDEAVLEKMANDLYYRFNYTITTHGHHEDGYRDGRKDGSYRTQSENGVDMRVEYLSNEFGHQPNITFSNSTINEEQKLKGYSFLWFWN